MEESKELAQAIIDKLVSILGQGMAVDRAKRVEGLALDDTGHVASVTGDGSSVISALVDSYQQMLGPIAATFAKEAASPVSKRHPDLALPEILR